MQTNIEVIPLGAAGIVTGSSYYLKAYTPNGIVELLIDDGLFQGSAENKFHLNYQPYFYKPENINYVFLTHAHVDHSGRLPQLVRDGFHGLIYGTKPSIDLCKILLPDSYNVQFQEYRDSELDVKGIPMLYSDIDVQKTYKHFVPVNYDDIITISDYIQVRFKNAGHILGSSIIELWITGANGKKEKLVFSGDLGRKNGFQQPLQYVDTADYLFVESTYGGKTHTPISRDFDNIDFVEAMAQSLSKSGNVVIPTFAVDRNQYILFFLFLISVSDSMYGPIIASSMIYIDSPLAQKATKIYEKYYHLLNEDVQKAYGVDYEMWDAFLHKNVCIINSAEESMLLKDEEGVIILSCSGMGDHGRVTHHITNNLPNENSLIVFAGFQAEGSRGRSLLNSAKKNKRSCSARIMYSDAFSSHADQYEVLDWLHGFNQIPKNIILVHGEPESLRAQEDMINKTFKTNTYIPSMFETFALGSGHVVNMGVDVSLIKDYNYTKPPAEIKFIIDNQTAYLERLSKDQKITESRASDMFKIISALETTYKSSKQCRKASVKDAKIIKRKPDYKQRCYASL